MEAGRPPDQMWQLKNQEAIVVECQVEKYSLSAHADKDQLRELVGKVQPRKLFLVHGKAEAREESSKSIHENYPSIDVVLPENGSVYPIKKWTGIAEGRPLSGDRILSEVSGFVRKMELKGPFHVQELAEIWFGTEAITPIAVKFFEWCLSLESQFFECRYDNLFYLRQII